MIRKFLSLALALSLAGDAFAADLSCVARLLPYSKVRQVNEAAYQSALKETGNFNEVIAPLKEVTDQRLKHPFSLRTFETWLRLPVNESAYSNAKFEVPKQPNTVPLVAPGQKLVRKVEFGYRLSSDYRKISKLEYLLLDNAGNVLEVGAKSKAILKEFKNHLYGRTLSREELEKISEINGRIFNELKNNSLAASKVKEFEKSRKWPEGLSEKGQLVYYDRSVIDLKAWAKKNGYTNAQMKDAGWFRLVFNDQGQPIYLPSREASIKIPFFSDASKTKINVWRTRTLDSSNPNLPRYMSWPLDRAIERDFTVTERLYNGWDLARAKGKTVVITEGEFKCLVTQDASGYVTVGIPGITEFDDAIISALVKSEAKEYVVILDRDARAKGMLRVDGISDSERAAYVIAKELKAAGATSVRVGVLPDAFHGEKVGSDDLILAQGPKPFVDVVQNAAGIETYAKQISLNTTFQEIIYRKQEVRSALNAYERSVQRGGAEVSKRQLDGALDTLAILERAEKNYLKFEFNNAKSLSQAAAAYSSFSRINAPNFANKTALAEDGADMPLEAFTDEILYLNYAPRDIDSNLCRPVPCLPVPYSSDEMGDHFVKEILYPNFPKDEYVYNFNVTLEDRTAEPIREKIPLVITKKKTQTVVAIIDFPVPTNADHAFSEEEIKSYTRSHFDKLSRFLRH
ncbi:MAG: DUF3854 domain-containing protein [Deltaproteobacteria bacterium]|nr:DUF3854 domain-containing protein [Deltaproteobacteria bacterium]